MSDRDEEQQPLLGDDARPAERSSLNERVQTALHNPKRLNALEKTLAGLAIGLLLLTATGFGLFAGEATKLGRERKHNRSHRGGEGDRPTRTVTATSTVAGPTTTAVPPPKQPGHKNVSLSSSSSLR